MRQLPNLVRRRGRSGYYFRKQVHGRDIWIALGPDRAEALRKLRSLKSKDLPVLPDVSVSDAAVRWLSTYVATSRSPKGQRLAALRVQRYLDPGLGHFLVRKIQIEDLRRYRLFLERSGFLSPQTVAHVLSDARCFFNWCRDSGLTDQVPIPRRLLPRIQERPPDRLSDEEIARAVVIPDPYGFIVRLGLATGLRWGELVRAQTTDVERGMLVVAQTKSGRIRRIPLSQDLLEEIRLRVGRLVPYAPSCCGAFARMVRKLSGLRRFHAHRLRHTFACRWLERGGSLAALQDILGHSSIVTTQRYARLSDDLIQREAARLGEEVVAKVVAKAL